MRKAALFAAPILATAVPLNFQATYVDLSSAALDTENAFLTEQEQYSPDDPDAFYEQAGLYKLVLEWDHDPTEPVVDKATMAQSNVPEWNNPKADGGVCDPATANSFLADDGLPYWLPRFYPRAVPEEVTMWTGIKHVNIDWQPCGHKDIVICHGESHYDFHLYYVPEAELSSESMRCDKTKPIHEQIICHDDDVATDGPNHKYFKLMRDNLPVSTGGAAVDYCVDTTSAVPASGIHYGDLSETLNKWQTPVTIMGSHDCALTFFEPMISWKWITDDLYPNTPSWPAWRSGVIVYNQKTLKALPTQWHVTVSPGCSAAAAGSGPCHLTITVYGEKCPGGDGCALHGLGARNCAGATEADGGVKSCLTNEIYFTAPPPKEPPPPHPPAAPPTVGEPATPLCECPARRRRRRRRALLFGSPPKHIDPSCRCD